MKLDSTNPACAFRYQSERVTVRYMKIKSYLLCMITLLVVGCGGRYYNHGVHKDDPQLQYPDVHGHQADEMYRFETVLSESPYIRIDHLKHPHIYQEGPELKSTIGIDCLETIIHSIKLEHRTMDGELIPALRTVPLESPSDFLYCTHEFEKVYDKHTVPEKVMEIISIELEDEGGRRVLEFRFPLEYKLDYTKGGMIMEI